MKALVLAVILALATVTAQAATYGLQGSWTDPTVVQSGYIYTPNYDAEVRVNGGAATSINNLGVSAFTATVTASPGDTIEARVRAKNIAPDPDLVGAWSPWAAATAPQLPTAPGAQPAPIIIVIPQ